ncbi:MAG: flagellar hook-associated protein FlgK [Azospirillum sp.]|nr:flagellar hook-associated protein FlgK [Azospirillum sp.]
MGLSSILSSTNTSLKAIQNAIQARSDNISNTQNEDYTRRDVVFANITGNIANVEVQRALDDGLRASFLNSTSRTQAAETYESVFQQLGDVLGTTQGTAYLQEDLAAFAAAWKGFETNPASSFSESEVIRTGQAFADRMRETSVEINRIETDANKQAASLVSDLNTKLSDLSELNKRLSAEPLASKLDPGLLDSRDALVKGISELVGVNPVIQSDGAVHLYSKSGILLVAQEAQTFQWNTGSPPYATTDIPPFISSSGSVVSFNESFTEGKLGAYINLLNSSTAPNASGNSEVGAIEKLREQLNGLAGLLTVPSPGTAYTVGGFSDSYANAASDRASDLAGGPVVAPNAVVTPQDSFFVVDNTDTAPAVWLPRADTFAINSSLADGSATVKRLSASAVVTALTAASQSLSAGGLIVANTTIEGVAGSIAQYHVDSQARLSADATRLDTSTKNIENRLRSQTGVNMDFEVAQLTVLQNSYAANARVINTVQSMFDTLLSLRS